MTLSSGAELDGNNHPFRYARILGIFHADVVHIVPGSQAAFKTMEFLWVRWFKHDHRLKCGIKRCHLHRIQFVQQGEPHAYGFLNPDDVIHGVHLIPTFTHGQTNDDYNFFYVNM